jgi:hypothetical protein
MVVYTATSVGSADSIARTYLQVELDKITDDPANNRSYVRFRARMGDNSDAYGGTGTCSWNVYFDGAFVNSGSFSYNFTGASGNVYNFYDNYFWVTHSTNGTRSVTGYTEVNPFNSFIQPYNVSGPITLTDYNRNPTYATINVPSPVIRGVSYAGGVTANNASGYSIFSGALPDGLSLNTSTGAITGTPTLAGTFNFTIRATGSFEGSVDTAQSIVINPPAPVFSDATVNSQGIVGTAYSDGVSASDTVSYSVFSGALPTGLSLNTSTGAITGTPTAPGVFTFVIRATNVTGTTDTDTLTITVVSGAKVWNGTAFVAGTTKVWDGTSFVSSTTKVWNGSSWVSAT